MQDKQVKKAPSVFDGVPHIIHGGDYNPDQWLDRPDILEEDSRLMRLAGINSASVGIFSWMALEPSEGVYTFDWLDQTLDRLHKNGVSVILATPSGARPAWMDRNHPEVLRVTAERVKNLHGFRHNHCFTSPYYRNKVREMNSLLAERYGSHPAVKMWHISNEYGGECHCALCQEAFRAWLRKKYHNDIGELNAQWWTSFWSHIYTSFDEIESPSPQGEMNLHGLKLDWKRFVSDQHIDFMRNEIEPLKRIAPHLPVVTNTMGTYPGIDLWKLAPYVDRIAWDSYPSFHNDYEEFWETGMETSFLHDLNRSLKRDVPFMLMENTPSHVNHKAYNKLKRPGVNTLSGIQAVAHGSDTVQYFQFRKSRGSSEKFHGAVVDHAGHENTRVFREVADLGELLARLDRVVGTHTYPEAAVIYDWENAWAIDELHGWSKERKFYEKTCRDHYQPFWKRGVSVDIISMDCDFTCYKIVVAPMLYMLKPTVARRLREFVENGGVLVTTYCTGRVNENDLCWLGGFPGDGLMEVAGIWAEELDTLYPTDRNALVFGGNSDGLAGSYPVFDFAEIVHPKEGCEVLASYAEDFYKGSPAVTKNRFGKGVCYHIAARTDAALMDALYGNLIAQHGIETALGGEFPLGVTVQQRYGDGETYYFALNFNGEPKRVALPDGLFYDYVSEREVSGVLELAAYGTAVLTPRRADPA